MAPANCQADLRAGHYGQEPLGRSPWARSERLVCYHRGLHVHWGCLSAHFTWLSGCAQGIDAQDQKTCDTDKGGCGQLWPIQRFLEGEAAPVFTLQLAWESHAESSEAIAEVLDPVQEVCSPS